MNIKTALLIACYILLFLLICLYMKKSKFGNYPSEGCDLARLDTGRPDGALGSPNEPTTLVYPVMQGYFDTGVQTAYSPNEMSAVRTADGLVHAGWINGSIGPGLTNSDRYNIGYAYQVGSSIQTRPKDELYV